MKKILITGGAGYGSKLAYDLIDLKKDIIIIDNLSTGSIKLLPKKLSFIRLT